MKEYRAESYLVLNTGEYGWCVKHNDDTICDVYAGEETARRIADFLNSPP